MIIGHLPAGYLLSAALAPRLARQPEQQKHLILVGLAFSVVPDLDILYFYLLDGRQHHHHSYWPHIPAFWVSLFATALAHSCGRRKVRPYIVGC